MWTASVSGKKVYRKREKTHLHAMERKVLVASESAPFALQLPTRHTVPASMIRRPHTTQSTRIVNAVTPTSLGAQEFLQESRPVVSRPLSKRVILYNVSNGSGTPIMRHTKLRGDLGSPGGGSAASISSWSYTGSAFLAISGFSIKVGFEAPATFMTEEECRTRPSEPNAVLSWMTCDELDEPPRPETRSSRSCSVSG